MAHLHVLNGDATLQALQTTTIQGDKMVWREVLSEGKVLSSVGAEEFWAVRASFFESFFDVGEPTYQELTIDEFDKLKTFEQYQEITLWFEYDLFCQLNLMALLSWFAQQDLEGTKLSLVCVGDVEGYDRLVGLGEIDPQRYPQLFQNRVKLTQADLNFALNFWMVFSSSNPMDLLHLAAQNKERFPYLSGAVEAHLQRFPSKNNGLNIIEERLLKIVHSGVKDQKNVVKEMLTEDNLYGFGDWQYFVYLKNLYPLLNEEEGLSLNPLGEKVMQGEEDFVKWANHDYYLGGTYFKDFRWDENEKRLISKKDIDEKS